MELSKKESEEKPRNLWNPGFDENKYQVKAINFVINNYNIIDNNDFFNHLF